jgi:hypothetical protein
VNFPLLIEQNGTIRATRDASNLSVISDMELGRDFNSRFRARTDLTERVQPKRSFLYISI